MKHLCAACEKLYDDLLLKVTTDRLAEPYSTCLLNLHGQEQTDMFQERYGTNYSTRVCSVTVSLKHVTVKQDSNLRIISIL